eukprot:TRINITY_DN1624_c1_g1_i2.p1 TRINITY_DN1624_c1_g1~~TRINITY_DN1624_c1_g1_i2.p1  ORF type:complete len:316 (+),score=51.99 TRINITY_DN1624_c1_g1_i2:362-1309(+)
METLSRTTPSPTLWTEIPNYDRHVFHPILAPAVIDMDSTPGASRSSRTPSPQVDKELMELSHYVSLKRHSFPEAPTRPVHSPTSTGSGPSSFFVNSTATTSSQGLGSPEHSNDEDMPLDVEFSAPSFFPSTAKHAPTTRRCHAPTPLTMMRGRSTPDMLVYLQQRNKTSPTKQLPSTISRSDGEIEALGDRLSKSAYVSLSIPPLVPAKKKKPTHLKKAAGGVRRRDPPTRPDGLPPLNLDVITRTASNETVTNSLLISPRVQKTPTPRRASGDPPIVISFAPMSVSGPDCSKALPSIQSPRSAFSTRDVIVQRS